MSKSAIIRPALCAVASALLFMLTVAFSSANISAQKPKSSGNTKRALIISLDGLDGRYLSEPDKYGCVAGIELSYNEPLSMSGSRERMKHEAHY
jgi:hypothetical protein